jgi:hypothetical protein
MKLSSAKSAELLAVHGIAVNEICDACHKPLDHIRFTRKDEPGAWCSRECRDGAVAAAHYRATRKKREGNKCWYCHLPLPADGRKGTRYCDSTCERNARRAKSGGSESQMAA